MRRKLNAGTLLWKVWAMSNSVLRSGSLKINLFLNLFLIFRDGNACVTTFYFVAKLPS